MLTHVTSPQQVFLNPQRLIVPLFVLGLTPDYEVRINRDLHNETDGRCCRTVCRTCTARYSHSKARKRAPGARVVRQANRRVQRKPLNQPTEYVSSTPTIVSLMALPVRSADSLGLLLDYHS